MVMSDVWLLIVLFDVIMKKYYQLPIVAAVALSLTLSSCIGSFSLFNKVKAWNETVSDKKWVNEVVFVAFWILPVYELTGIADLLVMNSIEFWSGDNPVDENVVDVDGKHAHYRIETNRDGYTITNLTTGDVTRLNFDAEGKTWSVMHDGEPVPFLTWVDNEHVAVPDADGSWRVMSRADTGYYAMGR